MVVAYDTKIEAIFDLRDPKALAGEGREMSALADPTWRDRVKTTGETREGCLRFPPFVRRARCRRCSRPDGCKRPSARNHQETASFCDPRLQGRDGVVDDADGGADDDVISGGLSTKRA